MDSIFTDFSKAFDKVPYDILIDKLRQNGICGELVDWFKLHLCNRQQYVVIKGIKSMPFTASSVVPQGSHNGPLLFNLFINDILCVDQTSQVYLFADDLKLCNVIKNLEHSLLLQNELDNIFNWCQRNDMPLNSAKWSHIKFTRKHIEMTMGYSINGTVLGECNNIRDLGVTFNSTLTFLPHLDTIIAKSSKLLGFIMKSGKVLKNPVVKITTKERM